MDRKGWSRRYASAELVWTAELNRFLAAEVPDLPAGTVLDLSAGEGRNAVRNDLTGSGLSIEEAERARVRRTGEPPDGQRKRSTHWLGLAG